MMGAEAQAQARPPRTHSQAALRKARPLTAAWLPAPLPDPGPCRHRRAHLRPASVHTAPWACERRLARGGARACRERGHADRAVRMPVAHLARHDLRHAPLADGVKLSVLLQAFGGPGVSRTPAAPSVALDLRPGAPAHTHHGDPALKVGCHAARCLGKAAGNESAKACAKRRRDQRASNTWMRVEGRSAGR